MIVAAHAVVAVAAAATVLAVRVELVIVTEAHLAVEAITKTTVGGDTVLLPGLVVPLLMITHHLVDVMRIHTAETSLLTHI